MGYTYNSFYFEIFDKLIGLKVGISVNFFFNNENVKKNLIILNIIIFLIFFFFFYKFFEGVEFWQVRFIKHYHDDINYSGIFIFIF